jgi:hypothetical protein
VCATLAAHVTSRTFRNRSFFAASLVSWEMVHTCAKEEREAGQVSGVCVVEGAVRVYKRESCSKEKRRHLS